MAFQFHTRTGTGVLPTLYQNVLMTCEPCGNSTPRADSFFRRMSVVPHSFNFIVVTYVVAVSSKYDASHNAGPCCSARRSGFNVTIPPAVRLLSGSSVLAGVHFEGEGSPDVALVNGASCCHPSMR